MKRRIAEIVLKSLAFLFIAIVLGPCPNCRTHLLKAKREPNI